MKSEKEYWEIFPSEAQKVLHIWFSLSIAPSSSIFTSCQFFPTLSSHCVYFNSYQLFHECYHSAYFLLNKPIAPYTNWEQCKKMGPSYSLMVYYLFPPEIRLLALKHPIYIIYHIYNIIIYNIIHCAQIFLRIIEFSLWYFKI